ncbi:hypothetical protein [Actinomadura litoris]|uniref:Chromosome segregation ATPase n=1 Tax=Actinomadura litoris TaxID=2678616 RepID=A0A7K1KZ50_9ACTN|nr:hypothetical protein [Actinomadura litoris]MUN37347.1 hypothetical protein [Actinomadura litoris]
MRSEPDQASVNVPSGVQLTDEVVTAPGGAPDPDAPYGRCKQCQEPLPAPAGTGRRREYHRSGEGPGGQDCKEAARRARDSAVGAALAQPLQTLIAWTDREEAARRAHARLLRETADRDEKHAEALTELKETLAARNSELENEIAQARDAVTEADNARRSAERREQTARDQADAARDAVRQADERAAEAAERTRLAERAAAAEQVARAKAEQETAEAIKSGNQARAALEETRRRLAETEAHLRRVQGELERVRDERDDRAARLEASTADLAATRQALTEKDAVIGDLTTRLEHAEQQTDAVRRQGVQDLRTAREAAEREVDQARSRQLDAEETAERMRGERDQARTDLAVAQAGHRAQLQALERERAAARAEADAQRERAVTAEQQAASRHPSDRPGV